MKYVGGLVLLLYSGVMLLGYEPFTQEEREVVPKGARHGPGGLLLWHSGYRGGK